MPAIAYTLGPHGTRSGTGIRMRLLLADDHGILLDSLVQFFATHEPDTTITTVSTFADALDLLAQPHVFDLVILDLTLKGMDGVEGIGRVQSIRPKLPVAIISGTAYPEDITSTMNAGAAGFLPKALRLPQLLAAIRLICSGVPYAPVWTSPPELKWRSPPTLSEREQQVLSGIRRGLSNAEIAAELELKLVSVKMYVRRLLKAFGAEDRKDLLRRVPPTDDPQPPER